ncbi:hypothetical protein BDV95DRAFT_563906 [Massariosphaeria phaeospora]|uniref:BTB domain-containing protein n=1 Tax=Massariosphaeria phaeospora TaxID=100035 RepID=A0A7C8IIA5_9PLEO|nr:hypothetical protein BDV95DRAFT_563906 [Massariosphaeria phaeospora]
MQTPTVLVKGRGPSIDFLSSPTVAIQVGTGPVKDELHAHQALLRARCRFFRRILNEDSYAHTTTPILFGQSTYAVKKYLEILYKGLYKSGNNERTRPARPLYDLEHTLAVFRFACHIEDAEQLNRTLVTIIAHVEKDGTCPPLSVISAIMDSKSVKAREWLLDLFVEKGRSTWSASFREQSYALDLHEDINGKFCSRRDNPPTKAVDPFDASSYMLDVEAYTKGVGGDGNKC